MIDSATIGEAVQLLEGAGWRGYAQAVREQQAALSAAAARVVTLEAGAARSNDAICQVLGAALGYPRFCDDQVNFPDATEASGVCVGDHVAESIADEAARRLARLTAFVAELLESGPLRVLQPQPNVVPPYPFAQCVACGAIAPTEAELDHSRDCLRERARKALEGRRDGE